MSPSAPVNGIGGEDCSLALTYGNDSCHLTRDGTEADFSFQYLTNAKLFHFWDSEINDIFVLTFTFIFQP